MFLTKICFLTAIAFGYAEKFPDHFKFGVASSAYQVEGAWNEDGKGPNMWDNFTHSNPSNIQNEDNADVACDSYHRYKEDVSLLTELGVDNYRFSISWSRILPTGYSNYINEKGLQYYKDLVKKLKERNITPLVTLYHWDLPQQLLDDGMDWTNPKFVDIFVEYARIVIKNLPDVGMWITINEPKQVCHYSYSVGLFPPALTSSGKLEYQCNYVLLKAHAAVYRMYKKEFPHYSAKMSIVVDCQWAEPLTYTEEDIAARDRSLEFECGVFLHPIFVGDWPKTVKDRINKRSAIENYNKSRLPSFTQEEIDNIKGTFDLLAFNHYTTTLINDIEEGPANETSYNNDVRMNLAYYPSDEKSNNGLSLVPWGIRKMINWFKKHYKPNEILITEIGLADDGSTLDDTIRIKYYTALYCNILDAIYQDDANITGLINWSLIDNFEWTMGYAQHFGHYYINFSDPELTRHPKKSVKFYQDVIRNKEIQCNDI